MKILVTMIKPLLNNRFVIINIVLFFLNFTNLFANNHYIDKNAKGNNDGSTWNSAWENFNSIDWNSILPGDTVYISGGMDSLIYTEMLHIEASGTSGNPIVFTAGIDPNHSGKVIIDVGQNFGNCIYMSSKSYVEIKDFYLRNSSDAVLKIKRSQDIKVENCILHLTSAGGIDISNSQSIIISGCNISTDTYIYHQTDGIYSQFNSNNIYQNNHIVISNTEAGGHDDCIQSYSDMATIISNNYLEQHNHKTSNAQGIYVTAPVGSDTTRIFNNIFNATQSESNGLTFRGDSGDPDARVQVIGNTVYGDILSSQYYITGTIDPVIKNNIGYSKNGSDVLRLKDNTFTNPDFIDNNIWKCDDNSPVSINSSGLSWNEWQSMGYDLHSYNSDPQFTNISNDDFTLKSSSKGIDHGQSLYPPYNIDIDSVQRPRGFGWDIGAYESDFTASTNPNFSQSIHLQLYQNYPNPFNPTTKISWQSPVSGRQTLQVYDVLGRRIATLVDEYKQAGKYEVQFNGKNLPSGIYFYRLKADNYIEIKKMVLSK